MTKVGREKIKTVAVFLDLEDEMSILVAPW